MDDVTGVTLGGQPVRLSFASSQRLIIHVPGDLDGGPTPIKVGLLPHATLFVAIGAVWASGLHQVDNPVFDAAGNLFVTYSGARGQEAPVSIFRVTPGGTRETFASGIVNPTSMAFGPDGHLYVSSRFEGAVYRVGDAGAHEQVASDLGVACGLAFDDEGWMYVGDRSGTVFRARDGRVTTFATLPSSVVAYHLAMSPWGELFVCAPMLGAYDRVFRIDREGHVRTLTTTLGRPQGIAFAPDGTLHIIDALAGASGLYRFPDLDGTPELVVSGAGLVGVAFGPSGEIVVTSNETAYRFP